MLTRLTKRVLTSRQIIFEFSSLNNTSNTNAQQYQSNIIREYIYDNRIFNHFQKHSETNVYTILFNQDFDKDMLEGFLKMSEFFITTDGAANRLYEKTHQLLDKQKLFTPNVLIGDFDSLTRNVARFYQDLGAQLISRKDQNMTDSEKGIRHLIELYEENQEWKQKRANNLLGIGAFGGRLDHSISNLSLLVKLTGVLDEKFANFNLYMMNQAGLAVIIRPGRTRYIRSKKLESHKGVGLFPLNGACKSIKTKGLKWDLGPEHKISELVFGKFVSSSNEFDQDGEEVLIENSDPLVFVSTLKISKDL